MAMFRLTEATYVSPDHSQRVGERADGAVLLGATDTLIDYALAQRLGLVPGPDGERPPGPLAPETVLVTPPVPVVPDVEPEPAPEPPSETPPAAPHKARERRAAPRNEE